MAKNSQEYWAQRRRQDKVKVINTGEKGIDNLKRLLLLNLKDVEKKIKEFYEQYGDNPAEEMDYKEFEKYKAKLSRLAKKNPQDKTLQKLAKQDIPKYKIDRLRALQGELQMQLTEATNGQEQGIYRTLDDVSKVSQSVLAKTMQASVGLKFNTIASKKMKQLLMSDWSGANWSERLWHDREKVGKKLTEILEKGVVQGTSLQKMSRELRDVTGQSFNNAFRLIRTETSHIDGQVTLEGYKQAGKELGLEYYEYDAFLDSRTSELCRNLDKKRFKVSDAEVGVNYPPMHPNCRSTTQLVLDEDFEDLGNNSNYYNYDKSQERIKPNPKDPAVLAGAKKGLPMTREQANNMNANPFYHKAPEYKINCQSCVVAFEARLRGYNVSAKPNYRLANSYQIKVGRNSALAWEHNLTGLMPTYKYSNAKNHVELYNWLNKTVKQDQRYLFSYRKQRKDGSIMGHIVNLDKTAKGELRVYDAQNGATYLGLEARRYLLEAGVICDGKNLASKVLRIDNCTFNKNVVENLLTS